MCERISTVLSVLICLTLSAGRSEALSVLVSRAAGSSVSWGYGVDGWVGMTALLDEATAGNVAVVDGFEDLAQMLTYDSLWLDARYSFPAPVRLSAVEVANIQAFIATGRRVVLFGENMDFFGAWDESVLSVVGGTLEPVRLTRVVASLPGHELTSGVLSVEPIQAGIARGGTPLFEQNFATLWGANVVTVLDVSLFQDTYLDRRDNAVFANNLARWVAASPPPPDGDGDGVPDDTDQCSSTPGAAPYGCPPHSGDYGPADWVVDLSELLRGIQLYNVGEYSCDPQGEDGYAPEAGDRTCAPHASDYNPQDWSINLSELLRAIQFYNSGGYHPDPAGEDGFAPGL